MGKRKGLLSLLLSLVIGTSSLPSMNLFASETKTGYGQTGQTKYIRGISKMAGLIERKNYSYKDYGETAIELNKVLFDFANYPKGTPTYIGGFINTDEVTSFGMDAYVKNILSPQKDAGEAVAQMPAVLSALLMGIDKTNEKWDSGTYDFVEMLNIFYNKEYGMILNNPGAEPNSEFWYMLYPQTVYARIYDKIKDKPNYKNALIMKQNILTMADNYVKALPYFVDKNGDPNFDFTYFDFSNMRPVVNNQTEAPNHAITFILYAAYTQTGDQKYLNSMKKYMDWIDDFNNNPNYEIMTDFGPSMAAIMNFKYGTDYDVEKFLNWLFDGDSDSRGAWGVTNGKWGYFSSDGLAGSLSDHGGYGFNMNTMNMGGTLATTAKYDPRFSTSIGKWFLDASNSARMYYPLEMPPELQSSSYMLKDDKLKDLVNKNGRSFLLDPKGSIGYEGVMKTFEANNASPFAISDSWRAGLQDGHGGSPETNQLTDFSIYGSANVGIFGAAISATNVSQILQIDLNKNDAFNENSYPQYLYYNPYSDKKEISVNFPENSVLFDVNTKKIINENTGKNTKLLIPSNESLNVVVLPTHSKIDHIGHYYFTNDVIIAKDTVSVSIITPSVQRLPVSNDVTMDIKVSSPEPIKLMEITAISVRDGSEKLIYSGKPLEKYLINTKEIPSELTNFIVTVETESGLKDKSSIKLNIINEVLKEENVVASWNAKEIAEFKPATTDAAGAAEVSKDGWAKIVMGPSEASWGSTVKTTNFIVDFDKDPIVNLNIQNPTNEWCLKYRMAEADVESSTPGYWGEYLIHDNMGQGIYSIDMNKALGDNAPKGKHEIQLNLYNIGSDPSTSFEVKNLNVVYSATPTAKDIVFSPKDIVTNFTHESKGYTDISLDGVTAVVANPDSYAEVWSQEFDLDFTKNPIAKVNITHLNGKYAIRFNVEGLENGNEIYTFFDRDENLKTGTVNFDILEGIKNRDENLAEAIKSINKPFKVRMSVLVEGATLPYLAVDEISITYDKESKPIFSVDASQFIDTFSGNNAAFEKVENTAKIKGLWKNVKTSIVYEKIPLDFDKIIDFSTAIKNISGTWNISLQLPNGNEVMLNNNLNSTGIASIYDLGSFLKNPGNDLTGKQLVTLSIWSDNYILSEIGISEIMFNYPIIDKYPNKLSMNYNLKTIRRNEEISISAVSKTKINLIWSSSNDSVATIDEFGKVKGVGVGTAIIKVQTLDTSEFDECIIQVLP